MIDPQSIACGVAAGCARATAALPVVALVEKFRGWGRMLYRELRVFWNREPGKMLDSVSKVERYRKEAIMCAELAREASPSFLAEIYRKVAVRYVFMAEELLKGPARNEDAFERADLMISRLRPPL
jgi:hypothetical protein